MLQQYPIEEINQLRDKSVYNQSGLSLKNGTLDLNVPSGVAKQSEVIVQFTIPKTATTFGINVIHVRCVETPCQN
eukprot:m.311794 g.311794  ORF g.311794 m.311794 type:complete len:75 (+) comp16482_c0_seq57:1848-2072(+)